MLQKRPKGLWRTFELYVLVFHALYMSAVRIRASVVNHPLLSSTYCVALKLNSQVDNPTVAAAVLSTAIPVRPGLPPIGFKLNGAGQQGLLTSSPAKYKVKMIIKFNNYAPKTWRLTWKWSYLCSWLMNFFPLCFRALLVAVGAATLMSARRHIQEHNMDKMKRERKSSSTDP